ncbi:MAG: mechanosensitive ion channel family protein [Chloroflexi bacterium]|nr:mechanosensitive ion channel family protein [Chloroflexota bacterium]
MDIYTEKFTNIFVILGELLALLVLFFLVMHLLRVNAKRLAQTSHFSSYYGHFEQAQNLVKWVLFVLFAMCGIALAAWDITLLVQNQNVWDYTLRLVTTILPLGFWIELGVNLGRILVNILVTYFMLKIVDRALSYFQAEAKQAELLRIETTTIEALFAKLSKIIKYTIYLFALVLAMRMLPLPSVIDQTASIVLKIYLILAVGRLLVLLVPDILDTLDALSKKYIRVINLDEFYNQAHTLIPLLKRSLEYMIYVQVATLALIKIPWMVTLFPYGAILLQWIAIFFLSRVLVEIFNWLIDKFMLGNDELSEGQQQQRLTFAPLIKSIARYATYFGAGLFLLRALNVNITPIVTAIGGVGLIVGLAAQPVLNDLVSGMFILFENLYMVGDQIEVSGARGIVEAIDVRTTHIRGEDGRIYMLRNGQIGQVINYSRNYSYAVVSLTVDNEADLDGVYATVHTIGQQLASTNKTVLSPTEIEGIQEVGPDGVKLRIVTKTKPGHSEKVARDLRARIKKSFAGETQVLPTVTRVLVK